jgi:hypothetical protein
MSCCAYQKLDPTILMMKSAEDRLSNELAEPLDRPMGWRIFAQRQMCSAFVVIAGVGRGDPTQMGLAEDNGRPDVLVTCDGPPADFFVSTGRPKATSNTRVWWSENGSQIKGLEIPYYIAVGSFGDNRPKRDRIRPKLAPGSQELCRKSLPLLGHLSARRPRRNSSHRE